MAEHLVKYFLAEKNTAIFLLVAGIVAIVVSALLFKVQNPYRLMAVPLIAVALLQVGVGVALYWRTDSQATQLAHQLEEDPAAFKQAEQGRMEKVGHTFSMVKTTEIVLLGLGLALAIGLRRKDAIFAIGVGLIIQATFSLIVDLFAQKRADDYAVAVAAMTVPTPKQKGIDGTKPSDKAAAKAPPAASLAAPAAPKPAAPTLPAPDAGARDAKTGK